MNIKTITCHDVYNYGASLQAFALQTFLEKDGHNVEIIDYKPDYIDFPYKVSTFVHPDSPVRRFTDKCSIIRLLYGIKRYLWYIPTIGRKRAFDRFTKQYLKLTKKYSCNDGLSKDVPAADTYIVGSDQVWNSITMLNGSDSAFYLQFAPKSKKRLSYAASFGGKKWDDLNLTEQITACLGKFVAISVRETSGKDICRDVFHVASECVLDPTLLLRDYSHLTVYSSLYKDALFYYRVAYCSEWGDFADYLGARLNLNVKIFSGQKRISWLPGMGGLNYVYPSIGIWLGAIASSAFVVTDSFHTVVFAILNRKPFLVLPSVEQLMERIISLLEILEITDHYYSSIEEVKKTDAWLYPIDYDAVHLKLNTLRKDSLRFLFDHLK